MLSLSSSALFLTACHGYWFLALSFQTSDQFSVVFSCETMKWMVCFFCCFYKKYNTSRLMKAVTADISLRCWENYILCFCLSYFIVARGGFNELCGCAQDIQFQNVLTPPDSVKISEKFQARKTELYFTKKEKNLWHISVPLLFWWKVIPKKILLKWKTYLIF